MQEGSANQGSESSAGRMSADVLRDRVRGLTPEQRERLRGRLAGVSARSGSGAAVGQTGGHAPGDYPGSFMQEAMWLLDQIEPGNPTYHRPACWRFRGTLEPGALEAGLQDVVRRHGTLRTTLRVADGEVRQIVEPFRPVAMPLTELPTERTGDGEAWLASEIAAEVRRPFDLGAGPLARFRLLRLGATDHVLLCCFHHAVFDGWSAVVLHDELAASYAARLGGSPCRLPELARSFVEHAADQRRRAARAGWGQRLEETVRHFRGHPGVLDLPTDFPRAPIRSPRGARAARRVSADLVRAAKALGRETEATLFMVLAAVLGVTLQRWTGTEDLVLGVPVAGRERPEDEHLIGCFIGTMPLRLDLRGSPGVREAIRRVRDEVLRGYDAREVPFERLIAALRPGRDSGRTPLFQVSVQLRNMPRPGARWPGLDVEPVESSSGTAKTDLAFDFTEVGDELRLDCEFAADLFRPRTIERWLDRFVLILRSFVERPAGGIGDGSLVLPEEKADLPDLARPLPSPDGVPVVTQFLEQARQSPGGIAIRDEGGEWTYGQLQVATLRLASRLRRTGVRPGDVVVVSGRSSFGLVAAILGVLAARGVFLAIDPAWPAARRADCLEHAGARGWVRVEGAGEEEAGTGVEWPEDFRALPLTRWTARGEFVDAEAGGAFVDLEPPSPGDPAYLFFTSGTTGKPKGIRGWNKGLSHFIDWERAELGVVPTDRVAQLTRLSFDVFQRDVFLPLVSGATLCIPDESSVASHDLLGWMARESIGIVHVVPSLADAWMEAGAAERRVPSLRAALFAGEPLTDRLVARWRRGVAPGAAVWNLYGPTETTLAKACYRVPDEPESGIQPIGVPLPHTQILVLRPNRQPCGHGEVGELAIRTPYRSLGYLADEALFRSRFVPNPEGAGGDGDLIYLTGDLGYLGDDGLLRIRGRLDDQCKIRGARVELAGIAACLEQNPALRRAVVLARTSGDMDSELVAYVVPAEPGGGRDLELEPLLDLLRLKVPAYMVPGRFFAVERLPLGPNGKVDRVALAREPARELVSAREFAEPEGPLAREVARIWAGVLRRDRIGARDHFFDLGGHSVLALRMLARLETELKISPSLADVFRAPTLEEFVRAIESRREVRTGSGAEGTGSGAGEPEPAPGAAADASVPSIRSSGRLLGASSGTPLFVVPGIFGLGGLRPSLVAAVRELVPYYADLRFAGVDDERPPHRTLEGIAKHLIGQIDEVHPASAGGVCLAGFSFGGVVAYEMAVQLRARGTPVPLLMLYDSRWAAGFPARGWAGVARELVRRVRGLPRGERGSFLRRLIVARWGARRGGGGVGERRKATGGPVPKDVAPIVSRAGLLKESVRLASKEALAGYRPAPYDGRVILFRSTQLEPNEFLRHELPPCNGWSRLVKGPLEIVPVPATHLGVFTEPIPEVVVRRTAEVLRRSAEAVGAGS